MGDVIFGEFNTRLDLPANRVLIGALKAKVDPLLIIGRDESGRFYMAGTTGDIGKILVLIEASKRLVMEWVD